jgi:hypothetical protein
MMNEDETEGPLRILLDAMEEASEPDEVEQAEEAEEVIYHPLFPTHPLQSVASFSVLRGLKALDSHCDPNCTDEQLLAFLTKKGPGDYRIIPKLTNGLKGDAVNRTVTRKVVPVDQPPVSRRSNESDDGSFNRSVARLTAQLDEAMTKARVVREKLEAELETEARKARRELDDQDRAHRSMRRKLEDEHLGEVNRLKQQVRDLEAERDALARRIREANDGTGVSQQVRDQIALYKAEAELAPPPSEFDGILAKGLEVLLPKLAGAFMGGGSASTAATEWKDPLASAPPPDEQH